MAIENRTLAAGTQLVANYKKQRYSCEVVHVGGPNEETVVRYRLADGREFKSPSAAGAAIMGEGRTCNGWAFWSLASDTPSGETDDSAAPTAAKPKRTRKTAPADEPSTPPSDEQSESLAGGVMCEECGEVFADYQAASLHATEVHPA